jgi:hypothetical protein
VDAPLTGQEAATLNAVLARHRPDLIGLISDIHSGRRLRTDEAEALQDALVAELMIEGVDPDVGAVNHRGTELDRLIDRVAELSEMNEP